MTRERLLQAAAALVALLLLALHLAAIPTENVNWDELAQLDRAARSLATGQLHGGGRPGLAVLALMPFVADCTDEVAAARHARWLWSAITVAFVAGFYVLLLQTRRHRPNAWRGAALGTGLLVCVPIFLRWSLQVRTDQGALAGALWGGVALLAALRRPRPGWLAALAGLGFGVGFLFSQKAVYAGGLVAILALADRLADRRAGRPFELRRAVVTGLVATGVAVAVVAGFPRVVALWWQPAPPYEVEAGLAVFDYYRRTLGDRVLLGMQPTLFVHLLLGSLGLIALPAAALRRRELSPETWHALALAVAILAAGYGVLRFHAGLFPYFWMTAGLFPAAALGIAAEDLVGWLPGRRTGSAVLALAGGLLLASGVPAALRLLADTQAVQAESLAFARRALPTESVGFHPESRLFCRRDPGPLPTFFSQQIAGRFGGADGPRRIEEFLAELHRLPVLFVVDSYRLRQFPGPIARFLRENYVPYRSRVSIPARTVLLAAGEETAVELVAGGPYRWVHSTGGGDGSGSGTLVVDGAPLPEGAVARLAAGAHRLRAEGGPAAGTLVYAVAEPPAPSPDPFYSEAALAEYRGVSPPWPGALWGAGR